MPTTSIMKAMAPVIGSDQARPAPPASTSTASIASGPYATDDSASAESTGRATSLRIRSCKIALLRSGGPRTARRTR
jgi:hypothetical protein